MTRPKVVHHDPGRRAKGCVRELITNAAPRRRHRIATDWCGLVTRAVAVNKVNAVPDDEGNVRLRDALQARDPALDLVGRTMHRHAPVAGVGASGDPEVLHVHHAGFPHVVKGDVQHAITNRELNHRGRPEARKDGIIQAGTARSTKRRRIG